MRWLHRYAKLLVAATLVLVAAGGMVTSTNSGLSVPDWPTTYGQNMFTFPLSKMVGGILYEHGHRLIASTVGFLTIGLVIFLWKVEQRAWVRRLGYFALGAVILQGLLGGLTVIYLLPDAVSISHAGLAQIFFCLTVTMALVTSPGWLAASQAADDPALRRRLILMTSLIYVQILLGATMRHTGAGLAIPDFPTVFGGVLPPVWTAPIAIHFAHRVGALLVTVFVLANAAHIWSRHSGRGDLVRPSWLLVVAVAAQVTLGATVVLSGKQEIVNTAHVAVGSIVLGTSLVLALRSLEPGLFRMEPGVFRMEPGVFRPRVERPGAPHAMVIQDVIILTKARVNALVVATTAGGYYMAAPAVVDWNTLVWTCVFTAMVASGAAAINQVDERDTDRLMERTRLRPLADRRMSPATGRAIAAVLSFGGLAGLWFASSPAATAVAFVTLVTYALVYTPMKRKSSLSTVVGAVPGALPPLIGWAAAGGSLASFAPWSLFIVMFLWQLPHFLAIAWIYRDQYRAAGLPMLPVIDADGVMTGRQAVIWAATIVPMSELPFLFGIAGAPYAIGALVLGLAQLAITTRFALRRNLHTARALFYGSITYLPLLWIVMGFARVR